MRSLPLARGGRLGPDLEESGRKRKEVTVRNKLFDVVVVGAGPGGATAAARLAALGARVVMLERGPIPRDKPCGGGLSPKAYRLLDCDISDLVLARPSRVVLSSPGYGPVSLQARSGQIWMVRRPEFDARLVEHARDRGADLRTDAPVRKVVENPDNTTTVVSEVGEFRARVVVGADGADSLVARSVGLRRDRDRQYTLALEVEASGAGDDTPDAIVDFAIPRGYAWLFPKGHVWNVGVGTDDRSEFRRLRQHLTAFQTRYGLRFDGPARPIGHKIPVWRGDEPLHRGGVVLVGDAAGVADPFFGEGIAYAIQTGRLAADAAFAYLRGDATDLSGYTEAVQTSLARDLRFWTILSKVVYRAPNLALRALALSRVAQRLADQAISGDKSFSHLWARDSSPP